MDGIKEKKLNIYPKIVSLEATKTIIDQIEKNIQKNRIKAHRGNKKNFLKMTL